MDGDERRGHQVEVPPTRVAQRDRRAAYLALGAGIAVIAGAVALAQLGPNVIQPPISIVAPTPAPTTAPATPPATLAPPVDPVSPRLSTTELAERVEDGTLEGRLVFVDGELRANEVACDRPSDGHGWPCWELAVPGLGVEMAPDPVAMPWRGDPPRGAWIVTVVRDGRLAYLGSLVPSPVVLRDGTALKAQLEAGSLPLPLGSLFQLDAFLVVDAARTCAHPASATPCPASPPFLAADAPLGDGALASNRGARVELVPDPVDIDPGALVTPGLFLLAPPETCDLESPGDDCRELDWVVVGRYEPARSVRVLAP